MRCWAGRCATRLGHAAREQSGLKWIEEALPPDDYRGYAELRRKVPPGLLVATGEHEATRWGFRMLLEMGCCDILQPDVGWCGGITELLKDKPGLGVRLNRDCQLHRPCPR